MTSRCFHLIPSPMPSPSPSPSPPPVRASRKRAAFPSSHRDPESEMSDSSSCQLSFLFSSAVPPSHGAPDGTIRPSGGTIRPLRRHHSPLRRHPRRTIRHSLGSTICPSRRAPDGAIPPSPSQNGAPGGFIPPPMAPPAASFFSFNLPDGNFPAPPPYRGAIIRSHDTLALNYVICGPPTGRVGFTEYFPLCFMCHALCELDPFLFTLSEWKTHSEPRHEEETENQQFVRIQPPLTSDINTDDRLLE